MIGLERPLLDQRLLIVGRSGYGKTNVAKGSGVEPLLRRGARVGIFDPTDSWFGLRLTPDGKSPAFKVVIFGGEHGDLPLNENAGAAMGRALATASDSWIISLAEMTTESAREKFAAAFLDALYAYNRAPLHLVIDEAETIAPQRTATPAQTIMTARLNQIVKRGRRRGFVTWLISQRPADLAKSVSSQADAVVSLSLTLPHDRKAIMDYVKDHDEDGTAAEMFKAMPKLQRGEGIVWWPGGGILDRRRFPLTKTFDSGKTPEAGDQAVTLKPLKVDALAKTLEAVTRDAEANRVPVLRARIDDLQREVATLKAAKPAPVIDTAAIDKAVKKARDGFAAVAADVAKSFGRMEDEMKRALERLKDFNKPNGAAAALPVLAARAPTPAPIDRARLPLHVQRKTAAVDGDSSLRPGERRLLTVMAQFGAIALPRLAAIAGMPMTGGTFKTYAARMRALGYMTKGTPAAITDDGLRALGHYEPLPQGAALADYWKRQHFRPGESKLFDAIAAGASTPDAIERATGMPVAGGTYKTYMARLKSLGVIEGSSREGFSIQEDLR